MTRGYIKLGGEGSQQHAGPWASHPALISSTAPQDCRSLISAAMLSQQPWPRAPRASCTPAVTLAPGLGCSEPQVVPAPDPRIPEVMAMG